MRAGNVAQTIVALCKAGGITQKQMAATLGISQGYLCDVIKGRRQMTDEKIIACKITGVRSALIGARLYEYHAKMRELRLML